MNGFKRIDSVEDPLSGGNPPLFGDRLLFRFIECRIEGDAAAGEIKTADEARGFGAAVHAVHANILPLNRERASVANIIQRHDDVLKLDVATTG